MKRKLLNVEPISIKAKNRFDDLMNKLHGCYVVMETDDKVFLESINKQYRFCVNKLNDKNWVVTK